MNKANGWLKEFQKFVLRGNVLDMAVGVIIGGAFTGIVSSLNADIISPLLGIFGGMDFSSYKLVLGSGEGAPVLAYGNFLTAVVNFLITAFVIFLLVKSINGLHARILPKEPAAPAVKTCPFCQSSISVKASRCPHCTSELPQQEPEAK